LGKGHVSEKPGKRTLAKHEKRRTKRKNNHKGGATEKPKPWGHNREEK